MSHTKDETVELFYNIIHKLQKQSRDHSERPNIRKGQSRCLYMIEQAGIISQRRLAELLNIRPTSLSETIRRLEEKDMIHRVPDAKDNRTYMISLTEKGKHEMELIRKSYVAEHKEWLDVLTDRELDTFFNILTKINLSMQ